MIIPTNNVNSPIHRHQHSDLDPPPLPLIIRHPFQKYHAILEKGRSGDEGSIVVEGGSATTFDIGRLRVRERHVVHRPQILLLLLLPPREEIRDSHLPASVQRDANDGPSRGPILARGIPPGEEFRDRHDDEQRVASRYARRDGSRPGQSHHRRRCRQRRHLRD